MTHARFTLVLMLLAVGGCASNDNGLPAATRPSAPDVPAEQGTVEYWLAKPAVASVTGTDFQKLWDACAATLCNDDFAIDRRDYRLGILTSEPLASKQLFEFWRSDAGDFHQALLSTLQTVRRTVRFDVTRGPDGAYTASPKVVVEQSTHIERRITTASQFAYAFTPLEEPPTRTTAAGAVIPSRYWYALGRDSAMERELANSVREKLKDP